MSIKIDRAFEKAGIPDMPMVRRHILDNLRKVEANLDKLTSTEIGFIIKGLNIGFHDAKNRQEADLMSDMDCVWVGADVQKLIPLEVLRQMTIMDGKKEIEATVTKVSLDGTRETVVKKRMTAYKKYFVDFDELY